MSRTTYANLFAAISTTYGVGNGTTTFNVPDLRGEFARGFDGRRGVDAGRVQGAPQAANLESHTHAFTGTALPTHNHTASSGTESADHTHTFSDTSSSAGAHTHTVTVPGGGSGNLGYTGQAGGFAASSTATTASSGAHTHAVSGTTSGRSAAHTHAITNVAASAGTPAGTNAPYGSGTDTRPRNVAPLACIKY